jgi:Flp pilus assembly protein TadB
VSDAELLIATAALGLLSGIIGSIVTHLLFLASEKRKEKLEQQRHEEEHRHEEQRHREAAQQQATEQIQTKLMSGVHEFMLRNTGHMMWDGCSGMVAILTLILTLLLLQGVTVYTIVTFMLFGLCLMVGIWIVSKILKAR